MKLRNLCCAAFLCAFVSSIAIPLHSQVTSGVNSDGRDFYIGMTLPSYNKVANNRLHPFFGAFILVSSYTGNNIRVSYFDKKTGVETAGQSFHIPERTGISIPLDSAAMSLKDSGDEAEYASCHITADQPINVQFFSTGACSGGSYLALATPALGKKYVIASYFDNDGKLGLLGQPYGPSILENSHGFFEIIAAFDSTVVTIVPNATTMEGHHGYSSGASHTAPNEQPYTIRLRRGQCYLVKSGSNSEADISGSIVTSNKPVAVLGGQENAALGGMSNRFLEGRDYMVEQMIPVDFWDTTGYVSIPLKDSYPADPSTYDGVGENYRTYTWERFGSNVQFYDGCLSGPVDMPTSRLGFPAQERQGVTCPVDFESTNGKKFSVMMYDQRNVATKDPYPGPSMMTVVPMSSWKTSYMWYVPANKFEAFQNYYVNILAPSSDFDGGGGGLLASYNGGTIKPLKDILSLEQEWKTIPNNPGIAGIRFRLYPGSYYVKGPHPFIVYNLGFRALDPDYDLGDMDGDDFYFSYANPVGEQLSSGDLPNFPVTIDSMCGKWHVCVRDNRKNSPGIRSVSILNDPMAVQFSPAKVSVNCRFDDTFDPNHFGEVELPGLDSVVCFDVLVNVPFSAAYAAILITDNAGNEDVVELHYAPTNLYLSRTLPIHFDDRTIGSDTCIFFTIKNTGPTPQIIETANLGVTKGFSLASTQPTLPVSLAQNDSEIMKICYTATDTAVVSDTLMVTMDCLTIPIQLLGSGATGLISAQDLGFGKLDTSQSEILPLAISNIGKRPFTFTTNWTITGSTAFSIDPPPFPAVLQPKGQKTITVKYSPKSVIKDTARINWTTDIGAPYTESVKSYSILTGEGFSTLASVPVNAVDPTISIRPNPASGSSIILSFGTAQELNTTLSIFDVLGREVSKRSISLSEGKAEIEIPIRNLPNGIYYARITVNRKILTEKFEVLR
ncbi:MAG: T9SS type A sorting domain-containing protein [Bacteroidota bacterium]|nr:T9SS type A sorting domain-containing protein [Bacteroidota bacterium]